MRSIYRQDHSMLMHDIFESHNRGHFMNWNGLFSTILDIGIEPRGSSEVWDRRGAVRRSKTKKSRRAEEPAVDKKKEKEASKAVSKEPEGVISSGLDTLLAKEFSTLFPPGKRIYYSRFGAHITQLQKKYGEDKFKLFHNIVFIPPKDSVKIGGDKGADLIEIPNPDEPVIMYPKVLKAITKDPKRYTLIRKAFTNYLKNCGLVKDSEMSTKDRYVYTHTMKKAHSRKKKKRSRSSPFEDAQKSKTKI